MSIDKKISDDDLRTLFESAKQNLHELSSLVSKNLKPPAGAYAFFNHNSHALHRLEDCWRILRRTLSQRKLLTELTRKEFELKPTDWPPNTPYSEEVQKVTKREHDVNSYMQLDMESLYVFGGILLDLWALQAIAVGNLKLKKNQPFVVLLDFLETEPGSVLQPIWDKLKNQLLWLHYQMRFYRNRFIVHSNRPWQRGTTRPAFGDHYSLHTPTPPGWLDDKKLNEEIKSLLDIAPDHIRDAPIDIWEEAGMDKLLEALFNNIVYIESKKDRDKISQVYGQKGGATPSFLELGKNLLQFISEGFGLLSEVALVNLTNIDLGRPHKTSEEMHKEWREKNEA